jgi:glycosyltransferase involved in cell wall biosynthesis
MQNKKILHLFRNLKYGGNQALAYNIIKYSSPEYSHSILSLQNDLEMNKEFEELGCDIEVINHKDTSFKIFKEKFERYVTENNVTTIITWFYPYILRLELPNVKFIHHIGTAPIGKPYLQWLKSFLLVNYYRNNKGEFIFASKHIEKQNKKVFGVKFKNSSVIHNGIDSSMFLQKKEYDHSESFVITMVGRLDGSKDFDTLIKVAYQLSTIIKKLTINIVGDGEDRERLEKLSVTFNTTSTVSFLGRCSNVPEILYKSDMFVFLNKFLEGFGLVLVEAMSTGLPVVTYNIGANSEIIDDGEDGYLVDTKDELIEKIVMIAKSEKLAKELGTNAHKKAVEKFDVKRMVKEYETRY